MILTWHALFRALHRGTERRPGLPVELVRAVFIAAQALVPHLPLAAFARIPTVVRGEDEELIRETIAVTAPFDLRATLSRVAALRLDTLSCAMPRKQSSWTWFEISIAEPGQDDTYTVVRGVEEADSEEPGRLEIDSVPRLRWRSHGHRNLRISGTQQPDEPVPQRVRGLVFGPQHEMWGHLKEGQVLIVQACAMVIVAGLENHVFEAELRSWTYFDSHLC